MKSITFHKYQGAGNDFILIDAREALPFALNDQATIERCCDRHFGIGADGLMLLRKRDGYDFEMTYYNSDGRPSSMCGNGGRCIVAFAAHLGVNRSEYYFLAVDGPHRAKRLADGQVALEMSPVTTVNLVNEDFVLDTGSPHYVRYVEDPDAIALVEEARKVRYGPTYNEAGINVNFVAPEKGNGLTIRTYERGVEDETLACGTGVTAAAITLAIRRGVAEGEAFTYPVAARGGQLSVSGRRTVQGFTDLWLTGPAEWVFRGEWLVRN